jgi:hypothetical protein
VTVNEVKVLLRIQSDTDDAYLAAMLPLVEEYVVEYCNQDFKDATGVVVFPGGVKIAIAKMCQYQMRESGVQSESLARHSVTYDGSKMPSDITNLLNSYRRPHFV